MPTEKAPHFAKPSAVERIFGSVLMALVRIGIVRGHFYVLDVRGRKTGKIFSVPVDPLDLDGHRYLVCPRGESNWVRNARAAGEVRLIRALHRQRYRVREVPPEMRPPILKAYLDRFASEVQRFFPISKGSAPERFIEIAPRYPVFELQPWE
jgi:deazaflavin-dependent oxidoreductase (nitroreductase family)